MPRKEEVGFEPTHRFTDLTVFKTVPLSQTWVFFHKLRTQLMNSALDPDD